MLPDWRGIVQTVAPTLASALGGPFAGMATRFLGEKLLGNKEADESDISEWFNAASPEQLLAAKNADREFRLELRKLKIREKELAYADTASARQLAEKTGIWPQFTIIVTYQLAFFGILAWLISKLWVPESLDISPAVLSLVSGFLGVLLGELPRQMSWMFGSSQGSKQKTTALNKALTQAVESAERSRDIAQTRPPPKVVALTAETPKEPGGPASPKIVLDDS